MGKSATALTVGLLSVGVIGFSDVRPAAEAKAQTATSAEQLPVQAQPNTYRLAEIAGRTLPTIIEEEDGCREELVSATLTLAGRNWTLVTAEREVCGELVETEEERETGSYSVADQTIRFREGDDDDDDDEDLDDADELEVDELDLGTVSNDGSLVVQLRDGETILVFRR